MIVYEKTKDTDYRYFDMHGNEIFAGDRIRINNRIEKVYLTDERNLGTDATNPAWIKSGRAVPCEFGIHPLEAADLEVAEKIFD